MNGANIRLVRRQRDTAADKYLRARQRMSFGHCLVLHLTGFEGVACRAAGQSQAGFTKAEER